MSHRPTQTHPYPSQAGGGRRPRGSSNIRSRQDFSDSSLTPRSGNRKHHQSVTFQEDSRQSYSNGNNNSNQTSYQNYQNDQDNRHGHIISNNNASHQPPEEVDAIINPTELFCRINSQDYPGALRTLRAHPLQSKIWISRRKSSSQMNEFAWKYLPLHLVCLQKRPPLELLRELLHCHVEGAATATPHDGNLPIHYVCESGCEDDRVIEALLDAFPRSLEVKNDNGKTPLLVCHPKTRMVLMTVLKRRRKNLQVPAGTKHGSNPVGDNAGSNGNSGGVFSSMGKIGEGNDYGKQERPNKQRNKTSPASKKHGMMQATSEGRNMVESSPRENYDQRQPPPPQKSSSHMHHQHHSNIVTPNSDAPNPNRHNQTNDKKKRSSMKPPPKSASSREVPQINHGRAYRGEGIIDVMTADEDDGDDNVNDDVDDAINDPFMHGRITPTANNRSSTRATTSNNNTTDTQSPHQSSSNSKLPSLITSSDEEDEDDDNSVTSQYVMKNTGCNPLELMTNSDFEYEAHRRQQLQPQRQPQSQQLHHQFQDGQTNLNAITNNQPQLTDQGLNTPQQQLTPQQLNIQQQQQQTIQELTSKLKAMEAAKNEEAKLSQRILAEAEADSVSYRNQIRQLQDEKERVVKERNAKDAFLIKSLNLVWKTVKKGGIKMKVDMLDEEEDNSGSVGGSAGYPSLSLSASSSHSNLASNSSSSSTTIEESEQTKQLTAKIMDTIQSLFSQMEQRTENLQSKMKSMEQQLSELEVTCKTAQSMNQVHRGEKETLIKKVRELERKLGDMEAQKSDLETELSDVKNKNSSLTVINNSLQEQFEAMMSGDSNKMTSFIYNIDDDAIQNNPQKLQENNIKLRMELNRLNALLAQTQEDKENVEQLENYKKQVQENEEKIQSLLKEQEALREKNRSLKDTVLLNNERYLKKVQDLGEKYSILEKANSDLRKRLVRPSSLGGGGGSSSTGLDLSVNLKGDDQLLYEV